MMKAVLLVLELFIIFTQYAVCNKLCRKKEEQSGLERLFGRLFLCFSTY